MHITVARLSPKFQLTIPKHVRDELGLHAGQKFAVIPNGKVIAFVPMISIDEARGLLKGADPTDYRDRSDR
jgi:AbrB family looped-hinge helix DNA binding protein